MNENKLIRFASVAAILTLNFYLVSCETVSHLENVSTPETQVLVTQFYGGQQPVVETAAADLLTSTVESEQLSLYEESMIEAASFSLETANQVAPSDILSEISFGPGGGGGLILCDSNSMGQPGLVFSLEGRLHEWNYFHTCGWKDKELITITIEYPNGEVKQFQDTYYRSSELVYALPFSFKTDILRDPVGEYKITFAGESGVLQDALILHRPSEPRLFWNEEDKLILYNFAPQEIVRVFAYSPSHMNGEFAVSKLTAWQTFDVDKQGNLILITNFNKPVSWFFVIGDVTGKVEPDSLSFYSQETWHPPMLK
jgi:hypothetical protein